MMRVLLVGLGLMLSACTGQEYLFEGWGQPTQPPVPEPLVGFVFDNGEPVDGVGQVVYKLNMARAAFIYPFLTMADDERFYDGQPVHRAVPGLVAELGDGYWNLKQNRPLPVNGEIEGDVLWAANLLALKVNSDGTVGPGVVFTQGHTTLERHMMPEGVVIGKLVDGAATLKKLRKGDRLVRVWAKNIPHPSALVKKEGR
jgi:cyclophilin family peptidyl-prolyl cis-trans isomerase